tara:strand:+ start:1121 stop:2128 length:1008 start_codon:yes stop_codon:yes gene_type:complete
MFERIESTPAKICLMLTTLITGIYALNFMFFGDCYVIGGDGCFTLLSNDAAEGTQAWGNGGPETGFNGLLMFGVTLSTLLMLNEGAKGMWRMMIPVIIGTAAMTYSVVVNGDFTDASEAPKYMVPLVLVIYSAAYYFLMGEGVNEGIENWFGGIKVEDKIAMVSLVLLVLMGLFYSLRMIIDPAGVIEDGEIALNYVSGSDGMGVPSDATVGVSGSLILIYTLWAANVLFEGPTGKWTIMHPSAFGWIAVTVSIYVGLVAGNVRNISDGNQMDIIAAPLVMLLVLLSYYRLKDEGMEDGMTVLGEPAEGDVFSTGALMMALVLGALFALNEIFMV